MPGSPFLDFLFFLWKELITATKRVKEREGWDGRKGEKISRQSIKSYELSIMLWTVRNLGRGAVTYTYKDAPVLITPLE